MTKEELKALGLTDEQAEAVVEEVARTVRECGESKTGRIE